MTDGIAAKAMKNLEETANKFMNPTNEVKSTYLTPLTLEGKAIKPDIQTKVGPGGKKVTYNKSK